MPNGNFICKVSIVSIVSIVFSLLLGSMLLCSRPAEANIFTTAGKVIPSVIRSGAVKAFSVKAGSLCVSGAEKLFTVFEKHPKATGIGLGFVYASRHENVVKHVVSEVIRLPVEIVSSLVGGASSVLADGEGHFPFKLMLVIAGIVLAVAIKAWFRYGSKVSVIKSDNEDT